MDFAGGRIYVIQSLDIDVMSEPPASRPGERPGETQVCNVWRWGLLTAVAGEYYLVKYANCLIINICSNVMPSRKIGADLTSG